jgi:ferritin-like metal-binding protein YciE
LIKRGLALARIFEKLFKSSVQMPALFLKKKFTVFKNILKRGGNSMTLETLQDLYVAQLKDLYSAENQLLKALPKMEKAASTPELKSAFAKHLKETEGQVQRLETIFETLDARPGGHKCKAMEGLIEEGEEMIKEKGDPDVIDAGLIAAAQRVEHYEIAGYGCVRTYAQELGNQEHLRLLQATLDEEGATDKNLTALAVRLVNIRAENGSDTATGRNK